MSSAAKRAAFYSRPFWLLHLIFAHLLQHFQSFLQLVVLFRLESIEPVELVLAEGGLHIRGNADAMHRVSIGVVALNTSALKFYKKMGFRQEGVLEEAYYYKGAYSDFVMMRILSREWR